jgi:type IV pilus assembly protein PilW
MKNQQQPVPRQSGLTLIEVMIGLGLGALLLFGVGLLFSQNKQSYLQNEQLARLQEEARFAIDELSRDLSMAGFFAEIVDSTLLAVGISAVNQAAFHSTAGATTSCGPAGLGRNWLYDFSNGLAEDSILAGDNVASGAAAAALFTCIDASQFQAGTDIIGIKRTAGAPSGVVNPIAVPPVNAPAPAGRPYIRENGARGVLFQSPNLPEAPGADADRIVAAPFNEWEYTPRIYFVRNFAVTAGDGVPTLCRFRLGTGNPLVPLQEECIAQGVENLQLEFGLDTNEDGFANVYVADPLPADLMRTVSVRIYLLMRTLNEDVGYRDERTYSVSNSPNYTPGDRFHRRIYASTVTVRNVNGNRLGPAL